MKLLFFFYKQYNETYQSNENAKQLNNVGISNGVEASKKGVKDCDAGAENNWCFLFHINDDS